MQQLQLDIHLSLAEILTSLSYALDLTSGQTMGHSQRTCLIGMRIAQELGLPDRQQVSLYHALLMKDAGCSSNAARMAEIFGSDDITAKRMTKITDWSNLLEAAKYVAAHTLPEKSLLARARRMLHIVTHKTETSDGVMQTRCDRGAQIALDIGLGEAAAETIRNLDEHWDGKGGPYHRKGEAIPLLGRIACLAQTMEVFMRTFDLNAGFEVLQKRSGKWFDPELVRVAETLRPQTEFWRSVQERPKETLLLLAVQPAVERVTEERIDAICHAFAQIVDAKSPFTAQHSFRVRDYAVEVGNEMGLTKARLTTLRRAALLHDLGKLAISNTILDKSGFLTTGEWQVMRQHPLHTVKILQNIRGFERLTEIAGAHHERLDGKGYHLGLTAEQLDLDMRILATADVFDALTAERPYRGALPLKEVYAIMDKDAGAALDEDCIAALKFTQRDAGAFYQND